ncbi:evolutionarily conserved signaling intermediate in Toll pathway, mitochondrial isoform X1 [Antechinus flavipes]|uniref:evolutionarily conserved signaling intermediate in Toll pathway, mitochondrial isoform X1 n=1 Tax=Antechinus flavipes TaxID=38775 RepID=UPI0022358676|nr:evolutionarily conserved signaling intermediate in Toll pathway, mitochondrial isoform X1 [Antechinus flavipes]XP_051827556.1 evolutionarily conserved signaling intermediate in Toll pathway, mitochondrial isoform X1 [Antechinus flavipes]
MNCIRRTILTWDHSVGHHFLSRVAPRHSPWQPEGNCLLQGFSQPQMGFHNNARRLTSDSEPVPMVRPPAVSTKALEPYEDFFEQATGGQRDKTGFSRAVKAFAQRDVRKRGHVDFIYLALRKMPEYGVERDLAIYNLLLDIFPKEVFVPRNVLQQIFNHYPRQQECGVKVLDQMENYGVMPNKETEFLLLQIFGRKSHPMLKYLRLTYWFPRFKNINPFPVPKPLPKDPVDLARHGLERIAADLSARVTVYQMPGPEDLGADSSQPHIVGIQSPDQQAALTQHNPARPVFVEGPFPLWLQDQCLYYHVLRADLLPPEERQENKEIEPESNFYYPMQLDLDLDRGPWDDYEFDVDEVEEGPVFAMCMAGAHDQATLAKWIQGLQITNPALARIPVVFRLGAVGAELQLAGHQERQDQHSHEQGEPLSPKEEEEPSQAPAGRRGQSGAFA